MGTTTVFDGRHSDVTGKVLGAFFKVYTNLGYGFSEKVYENALASELRQLCLKVEQQKPIPVYYNGLLIGDYCADIVVNDVVVLELKAARSLVPEHEAQLLNYLKASQMEVGMLLNFGLKPQHVRKVFDNDRKGSLEWTRKT